MTASLPTTPTAQRQRRPDVELLRTLSILGVIAIHATSASIAIGAQDGYGPTYWLALGANAFSRFSVPLFFAIAGWALIARSIPDDEGAWILRRLIRLIVPLVAWSVIYRLSDIGWAALYGAVPPWTGTGIVHWLGRNAELIVLGPGVKTHMWFMYYLIAMTVIIWLIQVGERISADLRSGGNMGPPGRFRAFLIVGIGVVVTLGVVASAKLPISWGSFVWTLGYAAIGFAVLSARPSGHRWLWIAVYVAASATILFLAHLMGYGAWPVFNQAPTVLVATLGVLFAGTTLAEGTLSPAHRARILRLGGLTFGAFLSHLLVLQWLRAGLQEVDSIIGIPGPITLTVLIGGTAILTFLLVAAWHRSRSLSAILG